MDEERFYFRNYILEAKDCPCYIKSVITTSDIDEVPDHKGVKFTTNISMHIDPKCPWHHGLEKEHKAYYSQKLLEELK